MPIMIPKILRSFINSLRRFAFAAARLRSASLNSLIRLLRSVSIAANVPKPNLLSISIFMLYNSSSAFLLHLWFPMLWNLENCPGAAFLFLARSIFDLLSSKHLSVMQYHAHLLHVPIAPIAIHSSFESCRSKQWLRQPQTQTCVPDKFNVFEIKPMSIVIAIPCHRLKDHL